MTEQGVTQEEKDAAENAASFAQELSDEDAAEAISSDELPKDEALDAAIADERRHVAIFEDPPEPEEEV
jgi:hypothetical protein